MKKVNGGFSLRGYKGKGGGSARQPVEAKDSLHSVSYARVLDLISEGPIEGLVNGLESVYLDGTPLQNSQGQLNFSGVQFDIRHGTQQQDHIAGFPASENTIGVGVELRYGTPWVRAITRPELSAVRVTLGVNGLSKADTSNGDIKGHRVNYAIDLQTDGGAWVEVVNTAFDGKTTSQYRRTHRIDLPEGATTWTIRVRRLTPNADSSTTADATVIDSIAEVIDGKLRYPMSALAGVQVDASQFQSIPTRSYHLRGRIIRVPANYDPLTGTYAGVWDGTFKTAYSNNPAWVFYDLVTHERYGLGKQIPQQWVNKWALYRIGQYCDELVPDGKGGQERRFTCNLYLQQTGDAHNVLKDLVSIFRGMVYWAAGAAEPVADMPRDPVYTYTQANVIAGLFTYTGSRRKDRPTTALVSYNDPTDMYRQKVVYYQDDEAVQRYGIKKVEISAFGCTSESQALRVAKWALLTAKRETRNVNFQVGLDGTLVAPGSVIRVADGLLAGKRLGGRIKFANSAGTKITLDSNIDVYPGDEITVILPNGVAETRPIIYVGNEVMTTDTTEYTADSVQLTADVVGGQKGTSYTADTTAFTADHTGLTADAEGPDSSVMITVSPAFSMRPPPESVWALDAEYLKTQLFTVVSVSEAGKGVFDISAVQHEPGKFAAIDYGTKLDDRPITIVPAKEQLAPNAVAITSYEVVAQGVSSTTVAIEWDAPPEAVAYEVEWRRDNSDWVKVPKQYSTRLEIENAYSGVYVARVRAINAIEIPSLWTQSAPTEVTGLMAAPPKVVDFRAEPLVFGIRLEWGFPDGLYVADYVEIRYAETNNFDGARLLGNFPYPQNVHELMGLGAGKGFYFWARIVDKNGLPGEWSSSIYGQSSSDANEIMDYIEGQIDETSLAQSLREEIEKIPLIEIDISGIKDNIDGINSDLSGIATDIVDLGTQISTEIDSRESADEALSSRIDVVSAGVSGNAAAITNEATARANADSALSSQIDTVAATASGNTAAITAEATARANADSALSTRIDTLAATTGNNTAAITAEATARANADSALSGRIDTVVAKSNDNAAAIQSEATARANADSALSSSIDTLFADVGDNTAAIQNEATARANGDTALASQVSTVQATADNAAQAASNAAAAAGAKGKVIYGNTAPAVADRLTQNLWIDTTNSANTPKRWNGSAWVAVTDKVAVDAAAAATAAANAASAAQAAVQTEATTRADADSALASQITTVQATANNASANAQTALDTVNEADGKLSAMWSAKVQLNANGAYHLAGIGVGVENNQGILQSQVLVSADRFAILPATTSAAASAASPFIVQGGQVFIRDAVIGNASITSAKIADWLESDAVNSLGQKVWRLNMRTGEMQFNGSAGGNGRLTINNNLVQVFDGNGTLRVRMGIW